MYHTDVVLARLELIHLTPGLVGFAELCDQGRDGQNGGREDRWNNAAHIDLQRQVGGGSAVHLTANHTTGVLHRNTTLGKLDVDDKDHDDQQHTDDRGKLRPIAIGAFGAPTDLPKLRQEAGADGHEDKDGHTLTKTLIGDQFGHPHDEAGAASHDEHHDHEVPDGTVRHNLGAPVVEQRRSGRSPEWWWTAAQRGRWSGNGCTGSVWLRRTGLPCAAPRSGESPHAAAG